MGGCGGTDLLDGELQYLGMGMSGMGGYPISRSARVALEDDNVINTILPTIYYVIVGRGPMAVTNHRTLRSSTWGRERLGEYPVLYVGAPNPWPRYMQHGLGQPNHLLSFPGFVNQPSEPEPPAHAAPSIDGGLDSQYFGRRFNAEAALLGGIVTAEWVGMIQKRDAPAVAVDPTISNEPGGDPVRVAIASRCLDSWPRFPEGEALYRLCLYRPEDRTTRLVYAAAIDICTGPGRPIVNTPTSTIDTDEIRAARTPPWISPENWNQALRSRRTLNGVEAIRDESQWAQGERVCVTAGGGVGLNAAEKARNRQCALDWFGRDALMAIFNNPRNITFLREPNTNHACAPGRRQDVGINNEDDLIAFSDLARMGRGAELASVADNGVAVQVRLSPRGGANIIRDWWGNQSLLNVGEGRWALSHAYTQAVTNLGLVAETRTYNRLVIPNGQQTDTVGQPRRFAHHLGFRPVVHQTRMVALETSDGLVRVLGAACNNYPGNANNTYNRLADTPKDNMWAYHATLPVSAVVDGFILCGVNTAAANRYFADHRNMNVNTMTLGELTEVVGGALAATIVNNRQANNGYRNLAHLQNVCASMDGRLGQLRYAYPAAG